MMNKNFYFVWISRLISILGSSLTTFGVSVWVYRETGKATPMAVTMLCSILPSVIFAPLSGMVCDYFNRKKVILAADSTAALTSLLLLLYLMTGRFDFGMRLRLSAPEYFWHCSFSPKKNCAGWTRIE